MFFWVLSALYRYTPSHVLPYFSFRNSLYFVSIHCCHLFPFLYGRDDLIIEEKYVVRMSLYAPPLFHFCFPLLPSNLSSHLLTLLATSYMRCKELYGSNVPHLVIPHDRRSCKGLRRPNVPLRGYQHLSAYIPPEYIRAPPVQPSSAEPYSPAVQHHSELSLYNTAVSLSVTPFALCRLIQVVYSQNSRLLVSHFLPPRPGKGLLPPGERPLTDDRWAGMTDDVGGRTGFWPAMPRTR